MLNDAPRNERPTLSLCMIVKNEAATLEQCLSTARPHVDEIVVIDTGSTDGTQDIARRYADTFEQIEWPESFAAARNYSFDRGTCDYIMYLDGDEYIPDAEHWSRLHEALRRPGVAAIQISILNLLPEGQIMAADRVVQARVFRNHPKLRFQGKVHNQIIEAVRDYMQATGERLASADVEAMHTGYALAPDKMKEKYRPRVHLLVAEYENPRSEQYRAYYGYQLALVYAVLGEHEEAAGIFEELNYSLLTPQNAFYTHLVAAQNALQLKDGHAALAHCDAMLKLDPKEPIAYYTTGLAFIRVGHTSDGMLMLLEAFNVGGKSGASPRFDVNPVTLLGTLARLCDETGIPRYAAAFRHLLQKKAFAPAIIQQLVSGLQTGLVMAERNAAA